VLRDGPDARQVLRKRSQEENDYGVDTEDGAVLSEDGHEDDGAAHSQPLCEGVPTPRFKVPSLTR
jgi:hypothetical protein